MRYNSGVSGQPAPAVPDPKHDYTRKEVRRVLGVREQQLLRWEELHFIRKLAVYSFSDLIALRALQQLRRKRVPTGRIRQALEAVRAKLREVKDPLTELKVFADGKSVMVQVAGRKMEALSGQILIDFDAAELTRLTALPETPSGARDHRAEADRWFHRGLELEQSGAPMDQVAAAYERAIQLDPASAGSLVNLGTLHFHAHNWQEAEDCYRRAVEADPNYALAYFNLGNLYDEQGNRTKALFHYQAALRLNPTYADAHYNIALLYQSGGELMKAVSHWRTFLKIDPSSHWSSIARRELEKLRRATVVEGRSSSEIPSGGGRNRVRPGESSPS